MISFNNLVVKKFSKYKPTPRPLYNKIDETNMYRSNMRIGSSVLIVQKQHQRTGELTKGRIVRFLTNKPYHPRGIKVLLDNGKIGRVQKILYF